MGAYLIWDKGKGTFFFDVVTSETQTKSTIITEHPVEDGADISDHIRSNLDRVSLEGFISNTPLSGGTQSSVVLNVPDPPTPITINGAIDVIGKAVSNLINPKAQFTANIMTFDSANDFVAQAILTLEGLRNSATLVKVVCPSFSYENMLIEEFEVSRDDTSGTGATFRVELREIRKVVSDITAAPLPILPRGNSDHNKGSQSTDPQQKKGSVALDIVKKLNLL